VRGGLIMNFLNIFKKKKQFSTNDETVEKTVRVAKTSEEVELIAAIENNNIDKVETLLKNGVDPNIKNSKDLTLLYIACQHLESIEITKLLLDYGADACLPTGMRPLLDILANFAHTQENGYEILELIIKKVCATDNKSKYISDAFFLSPIAGINVNVENTLENFININCITTMRTIFLS